MSSTSRQKSEAVKYALYGAAFGLLFPFLATTLDIYRLELPFALRSFLNVQRINPIHYIIDTAPLFLGFFAWIAGKNLDKLHEKNLQIQKAAKARQDFLANMSHEIRTPMVGVVGMIDLLSKNTELTDIQKEYVSTVQESSLNLLNILNQILDLSKIESGKFSLIPAIINFKDLIDQNVGLFLATSKAKGLQLNASYADELPEIILADENRLSQILSNLIGNAIKFTYEGEVHIKASLKAKKGKVLTILVEIIDTGIGISHEDQKNLFSRFNQFNNQVTLSGTGSGLGLAISKKLVKLMKGQIGVTSKEGSGSTFWFTYTAEQTDVELKKEKNKSLTLKKEPLNLNVLLVEDSETNILVSKQILKFLGCTTDVAKNGQQALDMFEEGKYDVILMDINLPELNGVETTKIIRKNYKNVPPIIALTSNALPGDAEKYTQQGLDDYITKPFTTEILDIKLKNWFGDHLGYH
ncbi:ATP-binding protein [Aquimarina brevivitae]|uniref:histidine kinase n=1 Tax=Aquimarina brevivitae TaxID=323412 RepID=A0A4Q7NYM6_9FLAO|nr:ATP-binding protein [Aquimarina brevivitae]RZS92533.1 signal transduction histidine kinase [Aquimarina brevivitae]